MVPPRGGASHNRQIIDLLAKSNGEEPIWVAFSMRSHRLKKRGLVIIISDCFGDIPSILKGLAHFNHAKRDGTNENRDDPFCRSIVDV